MDLSLTKKLESGETYKPDNTEKEALQKRHIVREFVKRSALSQMQDYNKWGIMTDWRYSYLTMSKISTYLSHLYSAGL